MNMFKPVKAKTLKEYFDALPSDRQKQVKILDAFIRKTAPSLKPYFANNMVGYGGFDYVNYKKEKIKWPVIALASQKGYISIYVCAVDGKEYVAEKFKKDLGKVSVGRSCIRIRDVADLNLKVLERVIKFAEKKPGLVMDK